MLNQHYQRWGIIHTDRDSQHLSKEYLKATDQYQVRRFYSTKANYYDNAAMESFHAILKKAGSMSKYLHKLWTHQTGSIEHIDGCHNRNRITKALLYDSCWIQKISCINISLFCLSLFPFSLILILYINSNICQC